MRTFNHQKIKLALKEAGSTQRELAVHVGTSKQAVNNWVLGYTNPQLDSVLKIAEFFGKPIDYFFSAKK